GRGGNAGGPGGNTGGNTGGWDAPHGGGSDLDDEIPF
ncbi:single-stranded DNA-binding protein, partial [Nguyenibacter vanlangensis]|nr:single-stranded DNA-binding protein [Nguyenibacter vanlangensis]